MTPREIAILVMTLGGVFFAVVAVVGLIRLPDLYTRAHSTSKSETLGACGSRTGYRAVDDRRGGG